MPNAVAPVILFDFDGTLAPNLDLPDMRRRVIELTGTYQVPESVWNDQYIVEIIDTSHQFLKDSKPSVADTYYHQAHQLIIDIEMEAAARTQPFPGMPVLLKSLRQQGCATGVVTRNCRDAVLATFPNILEHVDVLTARGDCKFLKPDVRHAEFTLKEIQKSYVTDPTRTMMVGDGHLDMRLGRALHMTCLGVLSGSQDEIGLRDNGAHHIISRLGASTDLLQFF
ncbi:MAG: HAD hydrolase-like protein [Pseudomonadota bacterium]